MSLNFREIDRILEELDLRGARIDKINQPDRFSLYLETWKPGQKQKILIGLHNRAVRISRTNVKQRFPERPPRFAQLLRARIGSGYIESLSQPDGERLILLTIQCRRNQYNLWIRLWSGNPNMILTDSEHKIVDVLFRKPDADELPGKIYHPDTKEMSESRGNKGTARTIRDYSGFADFNALIDHLYNSGSSEALLEKEKQQYGGLLRKRIKSGKSHLLKLQAKAELYARYEEEKSKGDLIQANIWRINKGDSILEAEDFITGEPVTIELNAELTPPENGEQYFKRYRKYKKGLSLVQEEIKTLQQELQKYERDVRVVEQCQSTDELEKLKKSGKLSQTNKQSHKPSTGLLFHSGEFDILVGRNSRENDTLLRTQAKGNDLWLHVRDYPGGYVFIKAKKGKSIPLDTLLDAANLALLYCSGKKGISSDVHYTEVKNLRRIKGGKTGQVVVNHDKNIAVRYDESRIKGLQGKSDLAH